MDADDISVPDRFEKQIKAYEENPHIAVIGGQINEFIGSQDNIVGTRIVPIADADIKKYLKGRCPMNLVTVMFRKDYVQAVGRLSGMVLRRGLLSVDSLSKSRVHIQKSPG